MRYFLLGTLIITLGTAISAQWMQTNLGGAQYGYNLYSTENEIFAATLNGVYSTTNQGENWFSLGLTNRLVFDVIKSNTYLLAATEGTGPGVYRSSDHGSTWLQANGIANQSVRAFTRNSSYIFACTWGGGIFRSNDDGANWQSIGPSNVGFRSIYSVGEKIFAGADKIYSTTDNGTTWQSSQLPYPAGDTWCFFYDGVILYAGDSGLYFSTDLGNTWNLKYGVTFDSAGTAIDSKIFRAINKSGEVLIASIAFNSIHTSNDEGINWQSFNSGVMNDWTFADVIINGSNLWGLTGFFGNAYKRALSDLLTGVSELKGTVKDFYLYQNFPNPFNPSTKIQYQVSSYTHVSLKVYDLLGNEVETLVDEYKSTGLHEVEFSAPSLPSGIYFYSLETDKYSETKKFVLIR